MDFPDDLRAIQEQLHEVTGELARLAAELPWSAEPADGYDEQDRWRPRSRPASPGYAPEQRDAWAALRARQLDLSARLTLHPHWHNFEGAERVAARMALKDTTRPTAASDA